MARRSKDTPLVDTADESQHDGNGDGALSAPGPQRRLRRDDETARITLTMRRGIIVKLQHAALHNGVRPCKYVEDILGPLVAPYVVSIRNPRNPSETEGAESNLRLKA